MATTSSDKKGFSSIVSIDLESKNAYRFERNEIKPHNLDKSSKTNEFFISYIYAKDIISSTLEMSHSIPDSDLQDAVEIKAYEELGLDTATEYKITFFETEVNDTKNRLLNVFAINAELVREQFGAIKAKTKYIDYVSTAPFLVGALYRKNILEKEGVQCFVYLQKNDAFLTIYRGGSYLYSKSLRYSLKEISEKFCELLGERIDEEDFYHMLSAEGMRPSNMGHQKFLMQLFGEIFLYINDVLIFAKRSYGIEGIDHFYFGTEVGTVSGIEEYSKSYIGLESYDFNFNIAINSKEWYVDQMHILMILASQAYFESQDESENFTIFKRPPAFSKRPSGKLAGILAASLLLSFAYPAFQYAYGAKFAFETMQKKEEFATLNQEANAFRAVLAKLAEEKKGLDAKFSQQDERLQFRKKLLDEIHEKKVNYPMKGVILSDLIELINNRNIRVSKIVETEGKMTFSLRSQSDKKLTELLKDISEKEKYSVSTEEIIKKEDSFFYTSDVTIKAQ
ncbi:MAG: hypothetical protein IBX45_00590 [Campylobacterales bacterium]|nr:hypothetical protein [Campylobacterales bacterium]